MFSLGSGFAKLECVNPDGHIFTRFCGRIFGDFLGVHSMLSMRAFGMCFRESLKDESCKRESRKQGRAEQERVRKQDESERMRAYRVPASRDSSPVKNEPPQTGHSLW